MARKILSVVGARPQFVKAAPVSRALAANSSLSEVMVHTGQHFDSGMSGVFFEDLGMKPAQYNLGIHGGTHAEMTGRMLPAIERVIVDEKPDLVLIYGDTNSTLAGALASAKLGIAVAHVEAGLRSFNRSMPEEINRVTADHLSALLFCPTTAAVSNLARENIRSGVHHVGDVMCDVVHEARNRARESSGILARLGLHAGGYSVATVHRAESTNSASLLKDILDYLKEAARARPLVIPVHPRTRDAATRYGLDFGGLIAIEPVGYLDMTRLMEDCVEVFTNSGGLQKEAYFHGKPCTTLRSETEWVETIAAGWN